MKKIGIIGAMDVEIELLKSKFDINKKENIAGFDFFFGSIDNKSIIIVAIPNTI